MDKIWIFNDGNRSPRTRTSYQRCRRTLCFVALATAGSFSSCASICFHSCRRVLRLRKKGPPVRGFVMRRPVALHPARFMHHGLYLFKMALLADTITCMTTEERGRVERMAKFIALFHGPLFLQASLAAAFPRLDLQLWKHMEAYELKEPAVAKATKHSVLRHLWYLTQELAIFGLFDIEVSEDEKANMRKSWSATGDPLARTTCLPASIAAV